MKIQLKMVFLRITKSYIKHSLSAVEFQNKIVGQEVQYSFYENKKFGPLQRGRSISLTDQGGLWLGYGFIRKVELNNAFNFNFDFFPGVYVKNNEEDLGGWIMFRSGIRVGIFNKYRLENIFRL